MFFAYAKLMLRSTLNIYFINGAATLPGLSIFDLIIVSTEHDMGVGTGSESDPSY